MGDHYSVEVMMCLEYNLKFSSITEVAHMLSSGMMRHIETFLKICTAEHKDLDAMLAASIRFVIFGSEVPHDDLAGTFLNDVDLLSDNDHAYCISSLHRH